MFDPKNHNIKLWCCITPERDHKTQMIMDAFSRGWGEENALIYGAPPPGTHQPFIVWGQEWLTLRIVPKAHKKRRPYYHVDNGFWMPARGTSVGFYRICYRGMTPLLMDEPDHERGACMGGYAPWRKDGRHVLIAMPGRHFGLAYDLNIDAWCGQIEARVRASTDRPIKVRRRDSRTSLAEDFRDAWAVVTHSSNVAVDAVRAGIPVFVEPTSASTPVGSTNLADLENPPTPDRAHWWASLMSQQFTLEEMRNGTAYRLLSAVRQQVDRPTTERFSTESPSTSSPSSQVDAGSTEPNNF